MEAQELKAYRNMALDRLQQLLIQLSEEPDDADVFVDSAIRQLSHLPERTPGSTPYHGLYGDKSSFDDYRDVATDRLRELILALPKLNPLDGQIDNCIRALSELPERPSDREPYTGLFMLRTDEPDPVEVVKEAHPASKQLITTAQLVQIEGSGRLQERLAAFTPGVNATLEKYQINTKLRIAHFLAQVMHESGGFLWLREIWGPTAVQKGYEGRRDLGNTQAGDGKKFMGRGLIQLTGRNNYGLFGKALGVDFIAHPELLEKPPYAVLVAGWFWDSRNLNQYADQDDLRAITRRINGGYNGLADRERYLKRAKLVLK